MIRKTAAILAALLSVVALGACSSSDNAKKIEESTSTTAPNDESTTTEEEETTTTEGEGLKSKIDLGGLSTGSDGAITAADEECVASGVLDDPQLSSYESFDDLQSGPLADREEFFSIFFDCVGKDTVIELFMTGFAGSGSFDDTQLACVRTTVEGLSQEDGIALLAGDETVTSLLTNDIATLCIAG